MTRRGSVAGLALGAVLALAGCASQHLTPEYGKSYRAALCAQAIRPPGRKPAEAVKGLDSQEAAIVSASYRRSLAPTGVAVSEEPVLFVAPQNQSTRYALPPPSVPPSR